MTRCDSPRQSREQLARRAVAMAILVASGLFLGYSVYLNWQELGDYQWRFNYAYLVLAALMLLLAFTSNVVGWGLIIARLGGPHDFRKNAQIYCLAAHAKRLPGLVWYVAGRTYLYSRENVPATMVLQGSLWEMVLQLLSGLAVYAILLPVYQEVRYVSFNYLLLTIIPLSLFVLSPSVFQRLLRWLRPDQLQVDVIQVGWGCKTLWFVVYLLGWLAGGSILYFLAGAVSSVSRSLLPACWGFVALSGIVSTLAFFLPGGLGAREVSLSLLLSGYVPLPVAIALALFFRVWILVGETILLLLFWSVTKTRMRRLFSSITQKGY